MMEITQALPMIGCWLVDPLPDLRSNYQPTFWTLLNSNGDVNGAWGYPDTPDLCFFHWVRRVSIGAMSMSPFTTEEKLSNKHATCGELPGKGIHGHAILTRNDQGIPWCPQSWNVPLAHHPGPFAEFLSTNIRWCFGYYCNLLTPFKISQKAQTLNRCWSISTPFKANFYDVGIIPMPQHWVPF